MKNQNQNRASDSEIADRLRILLAPPAAPVDRAEKIEEAQRELDYRRARLAEKAAKLARALEGLGPDAPRRAEIAEASYRRAERWVDWAEDRLVRAEGRRPAIETLGERLAAIRAIARQVEI